ncbi:sensor histidine kinase [Oerskovia paurometabola]|uniref:sensor histidine kinase n=1 Tax=Oerskovia paurometabola TaxID=162170 RepID=UPI0037F1D5D4
MNSSPTEECSPPPAPSRAVLAWVVLAVGALTALMLWGVLPQESGSRVVLDLGVALVALALAPLLWWSRRGARTPRVTAVLAGPVGPALVLAALAALSPAATPASTVATLEVARRRPLRVAVLVAAAGFAGHAVQALWRPVGLPLGWWLLCDAAVHAALVGWGAFAQARAQVVADLRERALRAEREQELRAREARAAERARIAREMHDTLAHRLSLLATVAGALEFRPDTPPAEVARAAGLVRAGVSAALEELREVVGVLRAEPDALRPASGLADVPRLVEESRVAGVDVDWEQHGDPAGVPATVQAAAFRAVQEGLTNARRHAPGSPVRVAVVVVPGEVRVDVSDDGPSPGNVPSRQGTGTGLVGLRERAGLLRGEVLAGPATGGAGFRLTVSLPWDA